MLQYLNDGKTLPYKSTAAVTCGQLVQLWENKYGVAHTNIAANAEGAVQVSGLFEADCTGSVSAGQTVYSDGSNGVNATSGTATKVGTAIAAGSSGGKVNIILG